VAGSRLVTMTGSIGGKEIASMITGMTATGTAGIGIRGATRGDIGKCEMLCLGVMRQARLWQSVWELRSEALRRPLVTDEIQGGLGCTLLLLEVYIPSSTASSRLDSG